MAPMTDKSKISTKTIEAQIQKVNEEHDQQLEELTEKLEFLQNQNLKLSEELIESNKLTEENYRLKNHVKELRELNNKLGH